MHPELLSPAGTLDKMLTAFAFGADAVYLGVPEFSLRARINEIDLSAIRKARIIASKENKRVYATLNIFAHNRHLVEAEKLVGGLKEIGVDALIVADPGILAIANRVWPEAVIHLSTQANCINYESALFWQDQGVKRVILGREASLDDIRLIKEKVPGLELECFIHGAMCMSYSGRCFLSRYLTGRSANLGDCIQPCRWNYEIGMPVFNESLDISPQGSGGSFELIEEGDTSYILNSKDLCLLEHLDALAQAGISSFKIEGRTKSAFYVAVATGIYRSAIDLIGAVNGADAAKKEKLEFWHKELSEKLYNRGFTEGFLFGNGALEQNIIESHRQSDWQFCGQVVSGQDSIESCAGSQKYSIGFLVHNSIHEGDSIEIITPYYDIIKMKAAGMIDASTGEYVSKAHGGQGKTVIIEMNRPIPKYSVIARRLTRSKTR